MRVFLLACAVVAAALLEASVLPWIPFLASVGVIGIAATVLAVARPQTHEYLGFATSATLLADALVGAPVGARTALVLAAAIILQPIIRSFRVDPRASLVVVVGVVLALADRADAILSLRVFPVAVSWGAMLATWWWAAAANVAVGYVAFRIIRERTDGHVLRI